MNPNNLPTDLTPAVTENALGPRSVSGESGSASQHSLPDQIAAAKFAASANALKRSRTGFRTVRLRPGGNADLDRMGGNY